MRKSKKLIASIAIIIVAIIGGGCYTNKGENSSKNTQATVDKVENKNSTPEEQEDTNKSEEPNTDNKTEDKNTDTTDKNNNVAEQPVKTYKPASSEKEALKTVENLVRVLYFKEKDYNAYKTLFTNPEKALNEEKFNTYRETHTAKDKFQYDNGSVEGIMKHMKAVKRDDGIYVYYLKDVNNEKEVEDATHWKLVEKDGKVLMRNDGL